MSLCSWRASKGVWAGRRPSSPRGGWNIRRADGSTRTGRLAAAFWLRDGRHAFSRFSAEASGGRVVGRRTPERRAASPTARSSEVPHTDRRLGLLRSVGSIDPGVMKTPATPVARSLFRPCVRGTGRRRSLAPPTIVRDGKSVRYDELGCPERTIRRPGDTKARGAALAPSAIPAGPGGSAVGLRQASWCRRGRHAGELPARGPLVVWAGTPHAGPGRRRVRMG